MEVRSNCPKLHQGMPDEGKHLYYNPENRCWYCFVCGYSGHGSNPSGDDERSIPHREFPGIRLSPFATPLLDLLSYAPSSLAVRGAINYLTQHHVDPRETAFKYRLMIEGPYLIFPVYRGEQLVYFQKRDLFKKEFLNPPIESKPLFWTRPGERVEQAVLVESFLNAVRADKFLPAIASFGKFVSDEAAEEIQSHVESVVICMDAGEMEANLKIARKLRQFGVSRVTIRTIQAPTGTDLCDLSDSKCERVLSCAS